MNAVIEGESEVRHQACEDLTRDIQMCEILHEKGLNKRRKRFINYSQKISHIIMDQIHHAIKKGTVRCSLLTVFPVISFQSCSAA